MLVGEELQEVIVHLCLDRRKIRVTAPSEYVRAVRAPRHAAITGEKFHASKTQGRRRRKGEARSRQDHGEKDRCENHEGKTQGLTYPQLPFPSIYWWRN
jgi:hypothetical protein